MRFITPPWQGEPRPHERQGFLHRERSYWGPTRKAAVKEISLVELLFRNAARFAAVSGVIALLVWLTWVMLDVSHMQSGFTLPY